MYAVLYRDNLTIHLQWQADTESDPLLEGSVIRIYVKNINPLFDELLKGGTINQDSFQSNTPWKTNEFAFFDLDNYAISIKENI